MTLRVTLEIVPYGQEEEKHIIETINISNIGIVSLCSMEYEYLIERNEYKQYKSMMAVHHKREDGAIRLTIKALEKILNDPDERVV